MTVKKHQRVFVKEKDRWKIAQVSSGLFYWASGLFYLE
jgi:hypothetical protein